MPEAPFILGIFSGLGSYVEAALAGLFVLLLSFILLKTWPVARETFMECVRSRIALAFTAILAVCLLLLGLVIEGDGTLKGRIQTFLAYATALTGLLLSLVVIFMSTSTITRDLHRKSIFMVATKPLARWQYITGRWMGVTLLGGALLAVSMGMIYGFSQYLRQQPTQVERQKAAKRISPKVPDFDRLAVESELFCSRIRRDAEPFNVDDLVAARMDILIKEKGLEFLIRQHVQRIPTPDYQSPAAYNPSQEEIDRRCADPNTRNTIINQIREELHKTAVAEVELVPPGQGRRLTFKNIAAGGNSLLELRYRLYPVEAKISGQKELPDIASIWQIVMPDRDRQLPAITRSDPRDAASSMFVPAAAVDSHGTLTVFYINDPRMGSLVKLKPQEVSIFSRTGTFEGNFLRAGVLVLLQLMFLAAVGVTMACVASFPIAVLASLFALMVRAMIPFLMDSVRLTMAGTAGAFDQYSYYVVNALYFLAPPLMSPADALVEGANIPGELLLSAIGSGMGLRVIAVLLIACLAFRHKELARIQV